MTLPDTTNKVGRKRKTPSKDSLYWEPLEEQDWPTKHVADDADVDIDASSSEVKKKKRKGGEGKFEPFRNLRMWEEERHSDFSKYVLINNLPLRKDGVLVKDMLFLLTSTKDILKSKKDIISYRVITHDSGGRKSFKVLFSTLEAALSAKKLNGVLYEGRHLFVMHIYDSYFYQENMVTIEKFPTDCHDEDVFKSFSSCGKMYAVKFMRKEGKCEITFETEAAKKQALSSPMSMKGHNISVSDSGPMKVELILPHLSGGVKELDMQNLMKGIGEVDSVQIDKTSREAHVVFKGKPDIAKLLSLNGTQLKGKDIDLHVQRNLYLEALEMKLIPAD